MSAGMYKIKKNKYISILYHFLKICAPVANLKQTLLLSSSQFAITFHALLEKKNKRDAHVW
jgi:hypothetical protein